MLESIVEASRFAPTPPIDESVGGATKEWIFLGAQTTVFLAGCVVAAIFARRTRSWIPVLCMVGGVLCLYTEGMIDSHLQVWWPKHAQPDVYSAWGRDLPLMLIPILGWYFGIGTYIRWYFLKQYGPRFPVWAIYFAEVGAAIALEPAAIKLGLWHYFGFQGLRIYGYPIWWPCVGGVCGVVAGTLIYRLEPYLKGPRVLFVPLIIPMAVVAVYWAVGWPMFNVLNLEAAHALVYAASALVICQALFVVWICTIATGHYAYRLERKQANAEQPASERAEPALEAPLG